MDGYGVVTNVGEKCGWYEGAKVGGYTTGVALGVFPTFGAWRRCFHRRNHGTLSEGLVVHMHRL